MTTNMRDLIKGFDINSAGYGIIQKLVMLDNVKTKIIIKIKEK